MQAQCIRESRCTQAPSGHHIQPVRAPSLSPHARQPWLPSSVEAGTCRQLALAHLRACSTHASCFPRSAVPPPPSCARCSTATSSPRTSWPTLTASSRSATLGWPAPPSTTCRRWAPAALRPRVRPPPVHTFYYRLSPGASMRCCIRSMLPTSRNAQPLPCAARRRSSGPTTWPRAGTAPPSSAAPSLPSTRPPSTSGGWAAPGVVARGTQVQSRTRAAPVSWPGLCAQQSAGCLRSRAHRGPHRLITRRSIGCIFAEILLGKPLFPGRNVVHQLELITDLLGTPSPEVIAKVGGKSERGQGAGGQKAGRARAGVRARERLHAADEQGLGRGVYLDPPKLGEFGLERVGGSGTNFHPRCLLAPPSRCATRRRGAS